MTRTGLRLIALACVAAVLTLGAACSGSSEQPTLDGTTWRLASWAEPDPVPASVTITAEFADRRIAGSAGINRYTAPVTTGVDGSFNVEPPISTKMAGPAEAMAAETAYLQRLQAATSYTIEGDRLVVNDADGEPSLTFSRT